MITADFQVSKKLVILWNIFQPVETVYVGSPTKRVDPVKKEKSVAIAAGKKPF